MKIVIPPPDFTVIITILITAGITLLVTLVFSTLALVKRRRKAAIAWLSSFSISLVVLICSVAQLIKTIDPVEKRENDYWQTDSSDKNKEIYRQQDRENWLDTLRAYTHQELKNNIPKDFYNSTLVIDTIADDKTFLPFIYPFSISYNQYDHVGDIIISDSVLLKNVSQLAFDENFVIAKIDNTYSIELLQAGCHEIEYVLFYMRTHKYLTFPNKEQLVEKSKKIGYTGAPQLNYISDSYRAWLDL